MGEPSRGLNGGLTARGDISPPLRTRSVQPSWHQHNTGSRLQRLRNPFHMRKMELAASCSEPLVEWRRFMPPLQVSVESIWGVSDPLLNVKRGPTSVRGVAHARYFYVVVVWPGGGLFSPVRDGIAGERMSGFAANLRSGS